MGMSMKKTTDRMTKRQAQAVVELTRIKSSGLETFRSQPHQDEIFTCTHRELLVQGGNRSGKSLCCAVKFAALALNKEITLSDGTKYNPRQDRQKNRPLTMWTIAYSNTYIGQTIYRLLFQPNLFPTILDKETRRYRAFDWTNPEDLARRSEMRPSRPLIPRSYVKPKSWSWLNKGNKEFERVTICNPQNPDETLAEIFAYSSQSEPKAGDPVDQIWIDEHIEFPQHYSEWQARLVDRRGCLFWSSWPRGMNQALVKLEQRAIEDKQKEKPLVKQVILTHSGNMQIDPEGKEEFLAGLTEEEKITRDQGRFNFERFRMYETFEADRFLAIGKKPEEQDEISKLLKARGGEPPDDWCRELILDPGTAHPAILFCAIPPPTLGEFYIVYDELYPGRADAVQLAILTKAKIQNYSLYRMLVDKKAGKQVPMGFSMTISQNYEEQFEKVGIKCDFSGTSFTWGLPEIGPRILKLKSWMHINPRSGLFPYLRIVKDRCPNLIKQLTEYAREDSDDKEFRPASNQKIDVAQCLEYWAASSPKWVPPKRNNEGLLGAAYRSYLYMTGGNQPKEVSYSLGSSYSPIPIK